MEGTLEAPHQGCAPGHDWVSIHLFMEGTLEGYIGQLDAVSLVRFNPSLHGRYSGRAPPPGRVYLRAARVSIHLFMEGTLEAFKGTYVDEEQPRFNPSLHGRYSGSIGFLSAPGLICCFNPSLHGRYSGSSIGKVYWQICRLFQSISSWKVLWKLVIVYFSGVAGHCFNPSLHGRYSGSDVLVIMRFRISGVSIHLFMEGTLEVWLLRVSHSVFRSFQSISSWKVLWKLYRAAAVLFVFVLFQSISSWKVLWKPGIGVLVFCSCMSFNPSLHGRYSGSSY